MPSNPPNPHPPHLPMPLIFFLAEGLKVITDAVHSICITTKAAWHIIISERCSLVYSIYIGRFMQHGSHEDVRWRWKAGERRAQGEVWTPHAQKPHQHNGKCMYYEHNDSEMTTILHLNHVTFLKVSLPS